MNYVNFRIAGQNIDWEGVNKALNISPTHICKKGDLKYDKITKQPFIYSEDCWTYDIKIENLDEIEEKLENFIDLFHMNKDCVQQLSSLHSVTLWITMYQEAFQQNLHFSKNVLSKISDLGIEMDITCIHL